MATANGTACEFKQCGSLEIVRANATCKKCSPGLVVSADKRQCLLFDSVILGPFLQNDLASLLSQSAKFKLVMRASRDGCDPKTFHRLVDGIGPTLIVVSISNTDQ